MAEDSEPLDLLGDPLRPLPDKRGRRKLRFPVEVYEKVEVLSAAGMLQDDIADALGISAPTLRKYFRPEIDKAVARQKAMVLSSLATQAAKGNVSAAKEFLAQIEKNSAAAALKSRERQPTQPPPARKGKKEERQDAAATVAQAGGKYAPPAAPKLFN
jgi:predicted transcriptional regulator